MKYIVMGILLFSSTAYAGINGYTAHSRANCVNNESISWWLGHSFKARVTAEHWYKGKLTHRIDTGWQNNWRIAAVHWKEPIQTSNNWGVRSYHYRDNGNGSYLSDKIDAVDCFIYDGWWDY